MSTNINRKPKPEPAADVADANPSPGQLALDLELPGPADVPDVEELPDTADDLTACIDADPLVLACILTGSTELRATAPLMVAAGADPDDVERVAARTDGYADAVAELLRAVQATIVEADAHAYDRTVTALARLARFGEAA